MQKQEGETEVKKSEADGFENFGQPVERQRNPNLILNPFQCFTALFAWNMLFKR